MLDKLDLSHFPEFLSRMSSLNEDILKNTQVSFEEMMEIINKINEMESSFDNIICDSLGISSQIHPIKVNETYINMLFKIVEQDSISLNFKEKVKNKISNFKPETKKWFNAAANPLRATACLHAVVCTWYFLKHFGNKSKILNISKGWESLPEVARLSTLKKITKSLEQNLADPHQKIIEYFNKANTFFRQWHREDSTILVQLFKPKHSFSIWNAFYCIAIQLRKREKDKNLQYMYEEMRDIYRALMLTTGKVTASAAGESMQSIQEISNRKLLNFSDTSAQLKVRLDKVKQAKLLLNDEDTLLAQLELIKFCYLKSKSNLKGDSITKETCKKYVEDSLFDMAKINTFNLKFADIRVCLPIIECFPTFDKSVTDLRTLILELLKRSNLIKANSYILCYTNLLSIYKKLLDGIQYDTKCDNKNIVNFRKTCSNYNQNYQTLHTSIGIFNDIIKRKAKIDVVDNIKFILENTFALISEKRLKQEIAEHEAKFIQKLQRNSIGQIIPFYTAETQSLSEENKSDQNSRTVSKAPMEEWIVDCELGYKSLNSVALLLKNIGNDYPPDSIFSTSKEGISYYFLVLKKFSHNFVITAAAASGIAWGNLLMAKLFRCRGEANSMTDALKQSYDYLKQATVSLATTDDSQISSHHLNLVYFLNEEAENLLNDIREFRNDLINVNSQKDYLESRIHDLQTNKERAISFHGPKYCWLLLHNLTVYKGTYNYVVRGKLLLEIKTYSQFNKMTNDEIALYGWRHNPTMQRSEKGKIVDQEIKELKRQVKEAVISQANECAQALEELKIIEIECNRLVKESQKCKYHFLVPARSQQEIEKLVDTVSIDNRNNMKSNNALPLSALSSLPPWDQGFAYARSGMPFDEHFNPQKLTGSDLEWYEGYKEGQKENYQQEFPSLLEAKHINFK